MKAAVLQLPSIGMSSTKLYNYIRIAHKKNIKLLLLGEYLLNPFFLELKSMPISMIKELGDHQMAILKELSNKYELTIVAPLVIVKKGEPYKVVVKFGPQSTAYYYQQVLINYAHWNEEKYFANSIEPLKSPLIFSVEGIKFAILNGFELHFDSLWLQASFKGVDCVLLPSVSTFESNKRWQELVKMRAFTHNYYVLRANRIGEYQDGEYRWSFYGDSLLVSPNGEVEAHLGNSEELMIVDLDHEVVKEARRTWGFKEAISKRLDMHGR